MTTITFHGAARTVTGSKYRIDHGKESMLVDAGVFQGSKDLRLLNWKAPDFVPAKLQRILLTHAHIDHIGYLPRLTKLGFSGPVFCTKATQELANLLLIDSAHIHEDDARYANKKGFSKHKPALPLFEVRDAKRALELLEPIANDHWIEVGRGLEARWHGAGHILGSTFIELRIDDGKNGVTVVFSGDIGRYNMPLHLDPEPRVASDALICESTYGDRDHDMTVSIDDQLRGLLLPVLERKGTVLIPAFAVGRSQLLTLILRRLMVAGTLPEVPLHIDSPMAIDATAIYSRHLDEHQLDADVFADGRTALFPRDVTLHRTADDSRSLNSLSGPRIIISASGMLSGGRVLHHLARLAPDRRNLIVLAGYQAPGTRGRDLLEGARSVRVHGREVSIRAECASISGLSAHGDRGELLRWLRSHSSTPRITYLTHGEAQAAFAFAQTIRRELGWQVEVPEMGQQVEVGTQSASVSQ